MNAPAKIDLETAAAANRRSAKDPTPADLEITVRDERFNRNTTPNRWWAGEPFGTAWHNAL
ncbi:MAG: metal-dependent hydrolase, partial [Altererythrobacter sp.]|nr:metal-dependent hydrolase [Altererythrobacter sp.]